MLNITKWLGVLLFDEMNGGFSMTFGIKTVTTLLLMSFLIFTLQVSVFSVEYEVEYGIIDDDDQSITWHDSDILHIYRSFIPNEFVYWVDEVDIEDSYGEGVYLIHATVSAERLRLRSEPSLDSEIITSLVGGTRVEVLYQLQDWVRVYFEGYIGYLKMDYVRIHYANTDISSLALQIVAHSQQFLGTPYVWGGNDLRRGVDCSGFVHHVFRDFGIVLYRNSAAMTQNGVPVGRDELLPADLLFFATAGGNRISHVGLYIGDGYFIHATVPGANGGVVISSLYEAYYVRTFRTARRVL